VKKLLSGFGRMGSSPWGVITLLSKSGVSLLKVPLLKLNDRPDPEAPALVLHPILLSGMGIMIGELLRLNVLSEECAKRNKWDFFFSSCPLMIEHGVASPPNAVAII
jgi:hypothetical protein